MNDEMTPSEARKLPRTWAVGMLEKGKEIA